SVTALSAPTTSVSRSSRPASIFGSGMSRLSKSTVTSGAEFRSRSIALSTNGAMPGLSSWWKPTPSTPQPHHFMCLTFGMAAAPFLVRPSAAVLSPILGRLVHQSADLLGHPRGELRHRLALVGGHRFAEVHIHRWPSAHRPILAVRHRLVRTDQADRQA